MVEPFRVFLVLFTQAKYDRALLRGVARYARLHGPWVFYLSGEIPLRHVPQMEAIDRITIPREQLLGKRHKLSLPNLSQWRATGVIGRIQTPEIAGEILRLKLPLIAMELSAEQLQSKSLMAEVSEIRTNSAEAGRLAASIFWNADSSALPIAVIRAGSGRMPARGFLRASPESLLCLRGL